jgi:hypothetical protein
MLARMPPSTTPTFAPRRICPRSILRELAHARSSKFRRFKQLGCYIGSISVLPFDLNRSRYPAFLDAAPVLWNIDQHTRGQLFDPFSKTLFDDKKSSIEALLDALERFGHHLSFFLSSVRSNTAFVHGKEKGYHILFTFLPGVGHMGQHEALCY